MHPAWKGGRHARLPASLALAYARGLADAELLSLRAELALLDARAGELLGRLPTGESGAAWRLARRHARALAGAVRSGDGAATASTLDALGRLLDGAAGDAATWRELRETVALRARVAEAERRRVETLSASLTAEQALALAGRLAEIVRANVSDPEALARISQALRVLLPDLGPVN